MEANAVQSNVQEYSINNLTHNLKYTGILGKPYGLINEKAHLILVTDFILPCTITSYFCIHYQA